MDKAKIFIVDDEAEARESLAKYLERNLECEIAQAGDGRQALEILKTNSFDVILLDIKMPGISGLDVLKKTKVTHPNTDVLIISAWDSQPVAGETLETGAADYIIKPSTIKVIFDKVCELLKKKDKCLPKVKTV